MKADKMLVPLDASPLAEGALPVATALLSDHPGPTLIFMRAAGATTLPAVDPSDAEEGWLAKQSPI
jgi:hypothetical protein